MADTKQTTDVSWDDVPVVKAGVGEIVKFDNVGDFFVGTYLGKAEVTTDDGEIIEAHTFENDMGLPVAIWASYDLNRKLADIGNGILVRVEYVRDVETKRGLSPMKEFKVQARF